MSNRVRLAVLGLATDMGGTIVLSVVNFLVVPIILHHATASLYGFWLAMVSVLGFIALTDMGIGIALTRLVAGLTEEKDRPALNRLVSTAFFAFCAAGMVFLLIGLAISSSVPGWLNIPRNEIPHVTTAYVIAIVTGALALPLSTFSAIVVGFQRMAVSNLVSNGIALIAVCITILLLVLGWGILALAFSNLFVVVAGGLINFLYLRRLRPDLTMRHDEINRADLKRILTFGGAFQIGRIANTVAVSSDTIIIAAMQSPAMVMTYSLTAKLPIMFSINVASKAPNSIFPALCQMFQQGKIIELQQHFISLLRYATRLAIVGGLFVALANEKFVSLWVGPQYYGGFWLNVIFVFWVLQDTVYRGTAGILFASGELKNWAQMSILEACLNLGISIYLASSMGLLGVALGTLIAKMSTTAWFVPYSICRRLNMKMERLIWAGFCVAVLRSLPCVLLTIGLAHLLPTSWAWLWVLAVGFSGLALNILSFEGVAILRLSNLPWRERIVFGLKQGGVGG